MTKIINAEDQILGRMCAYAAKKALLGEETIIVNAEKAIITGTKGAILDKYQERYAIQNKGNYRAGPFHQRRPDRFVRKAIRGMLPYKKGRGREAYKRVQVYIGVPTADIEAAHNVKVTEKELKTKEFSHHVDQYMYVGDVCKSLGGKW